MANPFRYLARDLLTWKALDPLPYKNVSFGEGLDQHSAWKGDLPLLAEGVRRKDWKSATLPSRTALFVDLAGTLVWGGVLWTADYDSSDKSQVMPVGATSFGSFFQHRNQAAGYTLWEQSGEDPMKVVRRIIEDALNFEHEQGPGFITGSKIPVVLNPAAGSGQVEQVSYPASSIQTIDSIVSTLEQVGFGVGFDVSYDVAYVPGTKTPGVTINVWYPLKGRSATQSGIVINARDTVKWTYPEDGTVQSNAITETGGSGTEPTTAEVLDFGGYPLLQKVQSRSQITTQALLDVVASGDLALYRYPSVTPVLVLPVSLPGSPAAKRAVLKLGEFSVGDQFTFRVGKADEDGGLGKNTSPRFPDGMEHEFRINQWTCTPKDEGLSTLQLDCGVIPLEPQSMPPPPH